MEKLTLAEVKRRLQPGTKVTLFWHRHPEWWSDPTLRNALESGAGITGPVNKVQTNAITMLREKAGKPFDSWLHWPKAKDFAGAGNEFTILENGEPFMKYRIEL